MKNYGFTLQIAKEGAVMSECMKEQSVELD